MGIIRVAGDPMKEKVIVFSCIAILTTLISLSIADAYGMFISPLTLPEGSYKKSCRNITMKLEGSGLPERVITAECLTNKGEWRETTIRLPYLQANSKNCKIINNDGDLVIRVY